jgi:hypothetical protein
MPRRLKITDADVGTAKANAFWKRSEVLSLDSPTEMVWGSRTSKLYYLHLITSSLRARP